MALTARPVPGLVPSVSLAPSALHSHLVCGGGSWLGEEWPRVFLRRAAAGRQRSPAQETEGEGTLPKAIGKGSSHPAGSPAALVSVGGAHIE